MKSIKIPFSFSDGGVAFTDDILQITQQKIVDVLTTSPGERAINTGYGADIRSLLYEPIDNLVFEDFKNDALDAINETLDSGRVVDISVAYPDSPQMAYPEDSVISITVRYVVPPYGGRSFTFNVSSDI
jgi:hypothetical protein